MAKMTFVVKLNGTKENPYAQWGLTGNPFQGFSIPEGMEKYKAHLLYLSRLGEEPIPDVAYIREYLKGWPDWFVNGLVERFRPGAVVKITCTFEEGK
jgi:hypothetical protein